MYIYIYYICIYKVKQNVQLSDADTSHLKLDEDLCCNATVTISASMILEFNERMPHGGLKSLISVYRQGLVRAGSIGAVCVYVHVSVGEIRVVVCLISEVIPFFRSSTQKNVLSMFHKTQNRDPLTIFVLLHFKYLCKANNTSSTH